jgi:predicted CopG family antitoxin
MATKTISIDLDAYDRLAMARTHEKESFSRVIKRAQWQKSRTTGRDLLDLLDSLPRAPRKTVEELDFNQTLDTPPTDRWA